MYKLKASNGDAFGIDLVGYQFPSIEVKWFIDWLRAIATGVETKRYFSFTENNIEFEWPEEPADQVSLRVILWAENRPPWAPDDDIDELAMRFELSAQELMDWAKDLRTQLDKFPARTGAGVKWEFPLSKRR